jgi:hypothetical protein
MAVVLPGAPEQVNLVSSDYDSILLQVVMPGLGTAPFTGVEVEWSSSQQSGVLNLTSPAIEVGSIVDVTVPDLQEDTKYDMILAIYNYGGKGPSSKPITVTTGELPPSECTHTVSSGELYLPARHLVNARML